MASTLQQNYSSMGSQGVDPTALTFDRSTDSIAPFGDVRADYLQQRNVAPTSSVEAKPGEMLVASSLVLPVGGGMAGFLTEAGAALSAAGSAVVTAPGWLTAGIVALGSSAVARSIWEIPIGNGQKVWDVLYGDNPLNDALWKYVTQPGMEAYRSVLQRARDGGNLSTDEQIRLLEAIDAAGIPQGVKEAQQVATANLNRGERYGPPAPSSTATTISPGQATVTPPAVTPVPVPTDSQVFEAALNSVTRPLVNRLESSLRNSGWRTASLMALPDSSVSALEINKGLDAQLRAGYVGSVFCQVAPGLEQRANLSWSDQSSQQVIGTTTTDVPVVLKMSLAEAYSFVTNPKNIDFLNSYFGAAEWDGMTTQGIVDRFGQALVNIATGPDSVRNIRSLSSVVDITNVVALAAGTSINNGRFRETNMQSKTQVVELPYLAAVNLPNGEFAVPLSIRLTGSGDNLLKTALSLQAGGYLGRTSAHDVMNIFRDAGVRLDNVLESRISNGVISPEIPPPRDAREYTPSGGIPEVPLPDHLLHPKPEPKPNLDELQQPLNPFPGSNPVTLPNHTGHPPLRDTGLEVLAFPISQELATTIASTKQDVVDQIERNIDKVDFEHSTIKANIAVILANQGAFSGSTVHDTLGAIGGRDWTFGQASNELSEAFSGTGDPKATPLHNIHLLGGGASISSELIGTFINFTDKSAKLTELVNSESLERHFSTAGAYLAQSIFQSLPQTGQGYMQTRRNVQSNNLSGYLASTEKLLDEAGLLNDNTRPKLREQLASLQSGASTLQQVDRWVFNEIVLPDIPDGESIVTQAAFIRTIYGQAKGRDATFGDLLNTPVPSTETLQRDFVKEYQNILSSDEGRRFYEAFLTGFQAKLDQMGVNDLQTDTTARGSYSFTNPRQSNSSPSRN